MILIIEISLNLFDQKQYDFVLFLSELKALCLNIEIKNIAVVEELRGRGFGKIMINSVIDNAERNGYERVIIGTGDAGVRQINLYKKCGFEIYDRKKNFFIDNFPEPIYENGIQLIDMVMLKRDIVKK